MSGGWVDTGWWAGLFLIAAAAWQPAPRRIAQAPDDSLRLIAVPLGFGALGARDPRLRLRRRPQPGRLRARRRLDGRGDGAADDHLPPEHRDAARLARRGADRRADRARQPPRARPHARRAAARGRERAPARARAVRPRRLQALQRHLRPPGGRRAARAPRPQPRPPACRAAARAFRMGGDEFCVLFEPGADDGAPLVESAAAALSEHGEGFSIGCSYGAITLPAEAAEAAEALRIADQRMYAQKHAGRMSAGRQSKDVLLRALTERNPDLGGHLNGVAELAERTARRLGLPRRGGRAHPPRGRAARRRQGRDPRRDPRQARPARARRSGRSSAATPLIGERIVSSAPSLSSVARLVRSSHERWDGTGYPDRLAADEIPLGSRIVAAADAYDAMTAGRPYAPPRDAAGGARRAAPLRRHAVRPRRGRGRARRDRREHAPRRGLGPCASAPVEVGARRDRLGHPRELRPQRRHRALHHRRDLGGRQRLAPPTRAAPRPSPAARGAGSSGARLAIAVS